jgi:iron complex outermembrane receptor protein
VTEKDLVTLQGQFYDGTEDAVAPLTGVPTTDAEVRGGNAIARWTHEISDTQNTQLQVYYDYSRRLWNVDETRNAVDVLFQHDFALGKNDQWRFNWGAQYFYSRDDLTNGPVIAFNPDNANFNRASGFVQVQWNLFGDTLQLTGGTKLEYNNWTNFEYQPTGRALWKFVEGNAIWGAISRAVREPTRVERDVAFTLIPVNGNKGIESEDLTAYEFGYRNYMLDFLSFDLSLFFNDYNDLVVLTQAPVPPDTFINGGDSKAWGGEIEVTYQVTSDLRFVTSYAYLDISTDVAQNTTFVFANPDDSNPQHTWMGRLLYNVPVVPVELGATTWYVSKIPGVLASGDGNPIGKYWRLDLRAAWQATDWLGLEFVAQNITEKKHPEWNETLFPGTWVPRSYYGKVTLDF